MRNLQSDAEIYQQLVDPSIHRCWSELTAHRNRQSNLSAGCGADISFVSFLLFCFLFDAANTLIDGAMHCCQVLVCQREKTTTPIIIILILKGKRGGRRFLLLLVSGDSPMIRVSSTRGNDSILWVDWFYNGGGGGGWVSHGAWSNCLSLVRSLTHFIYVRWACSQVKGRCTSTIPSADKVIT